MQLGESYWLRLRDLSQGCPGRGGEGRAQNICTGKTQLSAARTENLTNPLEPLQKKTNNNNNNFQLQE